MSKRKKNHSHTHRTLAATSIFLIVVENHIVARYRRAYIHFICFTVYRGIECD